MKCIFLGLLLLLGPFLSFADDAKLEECRAKLKAANKVDVIHDLQWKLPNEPRAVVGPIFFNLPFDAKENFVRTVNCFLMAGDESKGVNFDLLEWKNNKKVGRWELGKLKMK